MSLADFIAYSEDIEKSEHSENFLTEQLTKYYKVFLKEKFGNSVQCSDSDDIPWVLFTDQVEIEELQTTEDVFYYKIPNGFPKWFIVVVFSDKTYGNMAKLAELGYNIPHLYIFNGHDAIGVKARFEASGFGKNAVYLL